MTDWTNDILFGEWIVPGVTSALESIHCADWLTSLIADGSSRRSWSSSWIRSTDVSTVHLPCILRVLRIHGESCIYHG